MGCEWRILRGGDDKCTMSIDYLSLKYGGGSRCLNDDVWIEILLRLPVKSVIRFKLVCKRWLSVISTDHFHRLHTLGRHKTPPSLILASNDSCRFFYFNPIIKTAMSALMIPFSINLANYSKVSILSSCNGLLLLRDNYDDLYIYNPTTKQSRNLRLITLNDKYPRVMHLHLIFDPSVCIHYKIISIRVEKKLATHTLFITYQMEVFDSECGTWSVCKEPFADSNDLNFATAVHCGNMIYGITYSRDRSLYCFDINRNVLSFLARPNIAMHSEISSSVLLQVANGRLYYFAVLRSYVGESGQSAVVWELQGSDEWFLKYYRNLHYLLGGDPPHVLRFITETSTLLIHVRGKIVACNFLGKNYSQLLDLKSQPHYIESDYAGNVHQFAETLALV